MNVLSLFDGMSCGHIALDRLGIKVDKYYSAEIDKYAMKVTDRNYPDTIQLGDVNKIYGKDLPKIDLLLGGSPCQGFSYAGKQLNFNDPRSALFFEFVRLLKECKPKYFLLENVRMKKEYQDVISEHLGVKPIFINSSLVSAQNRERLYWTNIRVMSIPDNKHIVLTDILEADATEPMLSNVYGGFKEKNPRVHYEKSVTIRTASGGGHIPSVKLKKGAATKDSVVAYSKEEYRKLTPLECERLQTVPEGYTEGVSITQRYKMLGNGWTVDVIVHLLKNIKEETL